MARRAGAIAWRMRHLDRRHAGCRANGNDLDAGQRLITDGHRPETAVVPSRERIAVAPAGGPFADEGVAPLVLLGAGPLRSRHGTRYGCTAAAWEARGGVD